MTGGDMLVLLALGAVVAWILRGMRRQKGKSCCGSCKGCQYAGKCHG